MLKVGDKAPDFSLRASDKTQVRLKDFRGHHVLLLFFPAAFTGVCTKELCFMRDSLAQYNDLDAQILAVSVDCPYTLAKWKELEGFNFPLLSDLLIVAKYLGVDHLLFEPMVASRFLVHLFF